MQIKAKEASCTGEAGGLKEGNYLNMCRQGRYVYVQARGKAMADFHN